MGLRKIGPNQIHDRPADGGFKTSAIERALAQRQCCSIIRLTFDYMADNEKR